MAMVPQETQLAFEYTVLEMAVMGRYPHLGAFEIEGPDDLDIARDALASHRHAASGIAAVQHAVRRRETARRDRRRACAVQQPESRHRCLLLDEPTASLDLAYQLEIRSILQTLNRERNLTIVISTHDLNLAAGLCRDLILLDRGARAGSRPDRVDADSPS